MMITSLTRPQTTTSPSTRYPRSPVSSQPSGSRVGTGPSNVRYRSVTESPRKCSTPTSRSAHFSPSGPRTITSIPFNGGPSTGNVLVSPVPVTPVLVSPCLASASDGAEPSTGTARCCSSSANASTVSTFNGVPHG